MNKESRGDPDAILAQIKKESRGKLTVFLGAAAGVGKTYAMLETAHERTKEGFDVVIGWVETHGRKETEALVKGLEFVSPKQVEYRDRVFPEMDLDAVLKRRPQIALVDELAHTNIEGSRHAKRYQDVEELLDAGINVYTTFNVQHIESLNDTVAQITGVQVRETLPDRFLETADQIKLVDVPAEELIQRLREGKVYVPHLAAKAINHFFREGNINALRELALRYAAKRVGQKMEEYRFKHGIDSPWPTSERVMACISNSPFAIHVLRRARQMAENLDAEMIAVYVDSPGFSFRSTKAQADLANNIRLAEELGARVITVSSADVASGVLELAGKHNATQIVLGKPLRSRWRELFHGSVVDQIIRGSTGISVHVIPGEAVTSQPEVRPKNPLPQARGRSIFLSFGLAVLVTLVGLAFGDYLGLVNIAMLFLLPVLFASIRIGLWPSVLTATASVLFFDIFFVPPIMRLSVSDARYIITFAVFMVVAISTGTIAERLRFRIVDAVQRETRTKSLYELARSLSVVTDVQDLARKVVEHVADTFDSEVALYTPDELGQVKVIAANKGSSDLVLGVNELAVAGWAFHHAEISGAGTDILPGAKGFYIPLKNEEKVQGVLGVRPVIHYFSPEQTELLLALSNLSALAIARLNLALEAQEMRAIEQGERLRTALFNSISHDMKTPLSSILGAVTSLLEDEDVYDSVQKRTLLASIKKGALRMNRVVGNLLDMARLESGHMSLQTDWHDIQDIVGVALRENSEILQEHKIRVEIAPETGLVKMDFALMEQVLTNLLHNAAKFTPVGGEILVKANQTDHELIVSVADQGIGISVGDEERIFDKFYRLQSPLNVSGSGLGLSICRGIVEAHGGRIWANNCTGEGCEISFSIPLDDQ